MSTVYQIETVRSLFGEIEPLLESHYTEIARHKDKIALNPDWDRYFHLDDAGAVHCVTARSDGKLIGYFISFVLPHIHYKDHLMSMNDILYISPEHRKGTTAFKMFQYAEKTLRDKGVTKIHVNTKIANDFSPLLERLGYVEIERIFEKMLI